MEAREEYIGWLDRPRSEDGTTDQNEYCHGSGRQQNTFVDLVGLQQEVESLRKLGATKIFVRVATSLRLASGLMGSV